MSARSTRDITCTPASSVTSAMRFFNGVGDTQLDALTADLLVCPTTSPDTAETITAAQRGGLPVLAVDGGDAATLIENGRSGFLVPDDTARAGRCDPVALPSRDTA
jgi:glycosyltransferase involved in cell wall biosynthesis